MYNDENAVCGGGTNNKNQAIFQEWQRVWQISCSFTVCGTFLVSLRSPPPDSPILPWHEKSLQIFCFQFFSASRVLASILWL